MLDLREQLIKAVGVTKTLFQGEPTMDARSVLASWDKEKLVDEVLRLQADLDALRKAVRKGQKKVTVESAVRLILEDPELANLNKELIAETVRTVFHRYGRKCNISAASVGWYISNHTTDWAIVPRQSSEDAVNAHHKVDT